MNPEVQPKADELIKALGRLGQAQERLPTSPGVALLTRHAEQLLESLVAANGDS